MSFTRSRAAATGCFLFVIVFHLTPAHAQTTLFTEDFESSIARTWELGAGWSIVPDGEEQALQGQEHYFAVPKVSGWYDYSVSFRFQLGSGSFHTNIRETVVGEHVRYYVSATPGFIRLHRQRGAVFDLLMTIDSPIGPGTWYDLEIAVEDQAIVVYLNDVPLIEYEDTGAPIYFGRFSFESLENSSVLIDDIMVSGEQLVEAAPPWIRTGGPSGGLGYDVRIHPADKNLMFVTDNPSGINKSFDGGQTWSQKNTGISTSSGLSNDGIPIFSLTVDPSEPNIVWAGTQYARGIYKSVDGGETWLKKDNGVVENAEISFRGFGIHPQNPDIVFAGAELSTGIIGKEFDRAQGKIYRTEDGGDNWTAVWDGHSLVRFVLFDYEDPEILYASTGIFDREAMDSAGVGVLKSENGGFTWFEINNGIPDTAGNQFVGFLEMHPEKPEILYAASGCNATGKGGVFKTIDGGANWNRVLDNDIFTIVTISPSDPDVVYAGSFAAFYRSDDAGVTWDTLTKAGGGYGPPGVTAGWPISAVVDPEDPYTVFANNYIGGNFMSNDSGVTWVNSSAGYTGAQLLDIAIDPVHPGLVYTIGRSGPFRSVTGGDAWAGIQHPPAFSPEWYAVAMNPTNNQEILISAEFNGNMFKSIDGGETWTIAFDHPDVTGACPTGVFECRHGFKAIEYAPSNPSIIYAGMCKGRRSIDGDFPARASYGMFRSVNGGVTWDTVNAGLPTSLLNINCIAVQQNNANTVYVGTWKDGVYKTVNGGAGWSAANNGLTSTDIRSLTIHPTDTNTIYAGTVAAGIFVSADRGGSWTSLNTGVPIECPPYLLPIGKVDQGVSFEMPPKFTGGHDYYAAPWTSIRSIVIDPTDPLKMYAADYNTGVYATTNGGTSWVEMNDSLTMRTVNELAISADGSVLYAATFGGGAFRLPVGVNHAPRIAFMEPAWGSTVEINQSERVDLCVTAFDLDNDELTYTWFRDGLEWPGSEACLDINGADLTAGYHAFEVEISDGEESVFAVWEFDVTLGVEDDDVSNLPVTYSLAQNHPNPFNPSTIIEYSLPIKGEVTLVIHNILGQTVRTLVKAEQPAGHYRVDWDGTNEQGKSIATGVYFYHIKSGDFKASKKMLLLK